MDKNKEKTISAGSMTALLLGLVAVLVVLACAVSPIFVLRTINIHGNQYVQDEEIIRIAGIRQGENLFQLQTDEIRSNLTKDLRIDQAVVQRVFPSQLDITVSERLPVAMLPCDYGYVESGADGIILEAHRSLMDMPVPLITGVSAGGLFAGDVINDASICKVLSFLAQLPPESIKYLSEVNISNPEDVSIYAGSVQIRLGKLEDLGNKIEVTRSVLKELQQARYPIEYVDARFDVYSVRLRQQ